MESIYELWGKRNPEWEKRYQTSIMDVFTDYGKGVNQYQDVRGKIFGAGYEIYILAFFIGLYYNQTKPLVEDKAKRKVLGQAIMYWGNVENRLGRNSYAKLREYIFAALVAKTDIDWIALDKGDITPRSVVDQLIDKMEQYANFGFDYIQEKLEDDPNHFFKESAFLRVFTSFLTKETEDEDSDDAPDSLDDEPDSLDNDESDLQDDEKFVSSDDSLEKEQNDETLIDEESLRAEAEKPWDEDDLERLQMYFEHEMEVSSIAERLHKSIYSVQYQLSQLGLIDMPLNVIVKNTSLGGNVINASGEIVYSDEAPLKVLHDKIYRFNKKSVCLTVKDIKRDNGKWVKGDKMLVAYAESALYTKLSDSNFIDSIEDFKEGSTREENIIKVKGVWYDYYGNVLGPNK